MSLECWWGPEDYKLEKNEKEMQNILVLSTPDLFSLCYYNP